MIDNSNLTDRDAIKLIAEFEKMVNSVRLSNSLSKPEIKVILEAVGAKSLNAAELTQLVNNKTQSAQSKTDHEISRLLSDFENMLFNIKGTCALTQTEVEELLKAIED